MNAIAVIGIHTGIGKTVASAVLTECLDACYWKPVQSGAHERDILLVRDLIKDGQKRVFQETYLLQQPLSPHEAARIDGITIDITKFKFPPADSRLIVETAGGLLSPMSDDGTMADFISHYHLPVILVVQHYLGSINHTLLTIETLKSRGIALLGLVWNGAANASSEEFISRYTKAPVLVRIPEMNPVNHENVQKVVSNVKSTLLLNLHDVGFSSAGH
jgi:dethiobiotin synthetase